MLLKVTTMTNEESFISAGPFDHDLHTSSRTLERTLNAVRSLLTTFLAPLHVMAEIGSRQSRRALTFGARRQTVI
jgi:hypothetical protein